MNPILRAWADMAAGSIPPTVRSDQRDLLESYFYGGALAVLSDVVKILETGDPMGLVEYVDAAKRDADENMTRKAEKRGVTA